jgi:hypothetical protein
MKFTFDKLNFKVMKKRILFGYCLLGTLIGTLQTAQAQNTEEIRTSIIINNGDTVVNGKKFKEIPENEKIELRKKFEGMNSGAKRLKMSGPHINQSKVVIVKNTDGLETISMDSVKTRVFTFKGDHQPMTLEFRKDSLSNGINDFQDREIIIRKHLNDDLDWGMVHPKRALGMPAMPMLRGNGSNLNFERAVTKPNSSNFNYSTTDKDGFTTRTQISLIDPTPSDVKAVFKSENVNINTLSVDNLVFYPNFSSGKTSLSFTTSVKGVLDVILQDSSGNAIFSEKKTLTGDTYNKQFPWAKNGIYYLQVKQGSKTFLKKVIKN